MMSLAGSLFFRMNGFVHPPPANVKNPCAAFVQADIDNGLIMSRSENAQKLKAIRERAVGLRELARLIGWDASRYQYYEDLYKKPYMPTELIDLIRPHLVGRGSPPVSDAELDSLLPPPRVLATIEKDWEKNDPFQLVGARIRATREERGISLKDLANLVKINPSLLARAEKEDFRPNDEMLRRIARTLGLDGEDLVQRARREATINDLVSDPRSRPIVEALLLRTKRKALPEKESANFAPGEKEEPKRKQ
jgi:transcriptional regulator with XRE-family HTH domain